MPRQRRKPKPPAVCAALAFALCLFGVLLFWVESMRHNLLTIAGVITMGKFVLWLGCGVAAGFAVFGWKRGEGPLSMAAFAVALIAVLSLSWT